MSFLSISYIDSIPQKSLVYLYNLFIYLFFLLFSQNEYIKYPVLYELSHKYLNDNQPEANLPDRLEEIKEAIRKEIRKELKVRIGLFVDFYVYSIQLLLLDSYMLFKPTKIPVISMPEY